METWDVDLNLDFPLNNFDFRETSTHLQASVSSPKKSPFVATILDNSVSNDAIQNETVTRVGLG